MAYFAKPIEPLVKGGSPIEPLKPEEELYTHQEYLGRANESPAEKAVREGLNDHGRALEQLQKGNAIERTNRMKDTYPLDKDEE